MAEYITKEAAIEEFEWGDADVIEDYGDGCDFGFSRGAIKSAINSIPAADVAPIEALERLRDELCAQDLITMEGLKRLNALIDECAHGNEGGNDNG